MTSVLSRRCVSVAVLLLLVACKSSAKHETSDASTSDASTTRGPPDAGAAVSEPFTSTVAIECNSHTLAIAGPDVADVFVEGRYVGKSSPVTLDLPFGEHTIGLGSESSGYLKRRVFVHESDASAGACEVTLAPSDRLPPRMWSALLVVTPSFDVKGTDCAVRASESDVLAMEDFARANFGAVTRSSYFTMAWSLNVLVVDRNLLLATGESALNVGVCDPPEASEHSRYADIVRPIVESGAFDVVAFVRRTTGTTSAGAPCNTRTGTWLGYGWHEATFKTGIINVRFDDTVDGPSPGFESVVRAHIASGDASVSHEFFHTIERTYPHLPTCCAPWPLHDRDHYRFPSDRIQAGGQDADAVWQSAFLRGKISDVDHAGDWLGITPEALYACTTRDFAAGVRSCTR